MRPVHASTARRVRARVAALLFALACLFTGCTSFGCERQAPRIAVNDGPPGGGR